MVDENKKDIELDTDDAQETNIVLENQSEKNTDPSQLKKEDVDLGYTDLDVSKKEKAEIKKVEEPQPDVEVTTETKKDDKENLSKVSENAQKRIKELTFKYREAERREQAALEYAKGLQKKYSDVSNKYEESDTEYLKQYDARIDAERDKVKRQLKEALDSSDTDKVMEANDALTKLAVEKEKVRISLSEKEKAKKEKEANPEPVEQTSQNQSIPPKISPKARDWASRNEWFGNDKIMTSAVMNMHDELIMQGFDAESDDYYNEIDKQLRDYFPHKFNNAEEANIPNNKPVQNVAGVSRRQGGRRTVTLTKSQVAIAKKLGVPLEEYAKFVKEERK